MKRVLLHGAVFLALVTILGGSGFALLVLPAQSKQNALGLKVDRLSLDLRALEVTQAKEREFAAEERRVESDLVAIQRAVPEKTDEQAFLRTVDGQARDLGLVASGFRWGKAESAEFVRLAPFTLEVRGEPRSTALFASRIVAGEPLVELRSILVEIDSPASGRLTMTGAAVASPRQ